MKKASNILIKYKLKTVLVLFFTLFNLITYANQEIEKKRYTRNSTPRLATGLVTETTTVNFNNEDVLVNSKTFIKLGFDGGLGPNCTVVANIAVEPKLSDGTLGTSYTKTLEIEYNRGGAGRKVNDLAVHEIIGGRGAKISVTSLTITINGQVKNRPPANLFLELEYNVDRYTPLSTQLPIPNAINNNDDTDIEIAWQAVEGAEEYELEWTWVDAYDYSDEDDTASTLSESEISLTTREFNLNNTKIETTNLSYKIPPIFSEGYLIYRVRAVGRFMSDVSKKYYGGWSSGINTKRNVGSWPHVLKIENHEENKNWQYQASFAENGKKKEVVSYFDGTLRNRQTVTKINTNEKAVIGEVIYDNQGRPAVEVLPVPTNDSKIKFYDKFNLNKDGSDVFSHYDFDWDTNKLADKQMSTANGASKYYSSNNAAQGNWQDFVPDAKKYPFSQIEYTPDNTGRIKRKSGVGIDHQLGSDHEMKYMYLTPSQGELNRLFGYKVGNSVHYKKNIVIDPNGQGSVSYIDPQGRTIATALVGNAPENLTALYEERTGVHEIFETDILNKLNIDDFDTDIDNNLKYSTGNFGALSDGLQVSKQIGVVVPDAYDFNYSIKSSKFFNPFYPNNTSGQPCVTDTFPFEYSLDISLKDDKNKKIFSHKIGVTASSSPLVLNDNNKNLDVGTYTLSKDLRVNIAKLDEYADDYIEKVKECITADSFIPDVNVNDCVKSCDECYSKIGDRGTFIQNKLEEYGSVDSNGEPLSSEFLKALKVSFGVQYDELVKVCDDLCNPLTYTCNSNYDVLLTDVSPNGQYGSVEFDENNKITDPLSIFRIRRTVLTRREISYWRRPSEPYKNSFDQEALILVTKNDDGTFSPEILSGVTPVTNDDGELFVKPEELKNVADFLSFWQDSWAKSLIVYHPEYHYYQYAEAVCALNSNITTYSFEGNENPSGVNQSINSDTYNNYLRTIETFDQAQKAGLFNNEEQILENDPYFNNSLPSTFQNIADNRKAIMEHAITEQYGEFEYNKNPITMLEVAFRTVVCNGITRCNDVFRDVNTIRNIPDEETRNLIWTTYRSFYISLKEKINYVYANVYAKEKGGYNGCIGPAVDLNRDVTLVLKGYPQQGVIKSYIDSNTTKGFCNENNAGSYADKQKRFVPIDILADGETNFEGNQSNTNGADYEVWEQTGKCPLAIDYEAFLNGLVQQKGTDGLPVNITGSLALKGNYITKRLYESMGGTANSTEANNFFNNNVRGNTLELGIKDAQCINTIELPTSFRYTWSQYKSQWTIVSFKDIYYIPNSYDSSNKTFKYQIIAKVQIGQNVSEIILTGITCVAVGECGKEDDGIGDVLTPSDNPYLNPCSENQNSVDERLIKCENEKDVERLYEDRYRDVLSKIIRYSNESGNCASSTYEVDITNDSELLSFVNDYKLYERLSKYNNNRLNLDFTTINRVSARVQKNSGSSGSIILITFYNESGNVFVMQSHFTTEICNISKVTKFDLGISRGIQTYLMKDGSITEDRFNSFPIKMHKIVLKGDSYDVMSDFCTLNSYNLIDDNNSSVVACNNNSEDEVLFENIVLDLLNAIYSDISQRPYSCDTSYIKFITDWDETQALLGNDKSKGQYGLDKRIDLSGYLTGFKVRPIFRLEYRYVASNNDKSLIELLFVEPNNDNPKPSDGGRYTYRMVFRYPVNCKVKRVENFDITEDNKGKIDLILEDGTVLKDQVLEGNIIRTKRSISFCKINSMNPYNTNVGKLSTKSSNTNILEAQGVDGSFEACNNQASSDPSKQGTGGVECAGFDKPQGGIDTWKLPFSYSNYVNTSITESPDGGVFAGSIDIRGGSSSTRPDYTSSSFSKTINNLIRGQEYVVKFYQINATKYSNSYVKAQSFWDVKFGDQKSVRGPEMEVSQNPTWSEVSLTFTASKSTETITFSSESYSADVGGFFQAHEYIFLYIDGISVTGKTGGNLPPCDTPCIPQTVAPVSCTEQYQNFLTVETQVTDYTLPEYYKAADGEAYFCNMNYAYITESYLAYLRALNITSTDDFNFLTIDEFGNTDLNYGFLYINEVIAQYAKYNEQFTGQGAVEGRKTWREYVNLDYVPISSYCPPAPMTVIPSSVVQIPEELVANDCLEISANIAGQFSSDSFNRYLETLRARFKREYVQQAIETVVENLTEKHVEKEYHYTLYYYDQAGNLIQTVAPEGVNRLENANNDAINAYRQENPQGEASTNAEGIVIAPTHTFKTEYKYNSLNQLVWQSTPDGGITRFAYDDLGRIIASQNAKQLEHVVNGNHDISYTKYDGLGRIVEAGQLQVSTNYVISEYGRLVNATTSENATILDVVKDGTSTGVRTDVSVTYYDKPLQGTATYFENFNNDSRNRVTAVLYFSKIEGEVNIKQDYDNAIFYDYDVHGNVKEIVRRVNNPVLIAKKQELKKTLYEYDLISGNVNKVYYQKGQTDQFIHQYKYDADNRITSVQTSKDGIIWENDASYNYYDHGPLARTVLGDHKVQGIDYAYTIQGWLKMVNAEWMSHNRDMGLDSKKDAGTNADVAKDAFGYSLSYYNGDYKARVNRNATNNVQSPFAITRNNNFTVSTKNLYNGNIKTMVTAFLNQNETTSGYKVRPRLNNYEYDQLNRIKTFKAQEIVNLNRGRSRAVEAADYSYDKNGNLKTLNRTAKKGSRNVLSMDQLVYDYVDGKNQLRIVNDNMKRKGRFKTDIDSHTNNYEYDAIGQLTKDIDEGIANIEWTVSGKVAKITKTNGEVISFVYDALGNRISKTFVANGEEKTTYYMRDAQGNVMSVYELAQSGANATYNLLEQHIYGSSRLGLQQESLELDENSTGTYIPSTSTYAIKVDETYEAEWTDEHPFTFEDGENFSFKTGLKLTNTANQPVYWRHIAQFDHEDPNNPEVLYQLLVGLYHDKGLYYPNFTLRKITDKKNSVDKYFYLEKGITNSNMDIDFNITIIDKSKDQYNAQLKLNGKMYTIGNGILTNFSETPFNQIHYEPTNRLSWNTYYPLSYEMDYLSANINGKQQDLLFNEGSGEPSILGTNVKLTTKPDTNNWVKRLTLPNADYVHTRGDKRFELSNHLGNVLSVISDRKIIKNGRFAPDVLSYNDYYPFGMLIPTRSYQSPAYRYGFQGQEKDDEIKGNGNSINYKFRMHDPRVGRFFAVDPLTMNYPWYSPYNFSGNKVISHKELEGLEEFSAITNRDWTWRYYIVQLGDNLSVIAKATGVPVTDILKYNPSIENPDLIHTGQMLDLNGGSSLTTEDFMFESKKSKFVQTIVHLARTDETGPSLQSMYFAATDPIGTAVEEITGEEIPDEVHYGITIYQVLRGKKTKSSKKGRVNDSKGESKVTTADETRPSPSQSEFDIVDSHPNIESQPSFKNGKRAKHLSKGSVRPDGKVIGNNTFIEVKNYDITTKSGRRSLYNILHKQVLQRKSNLPRGSIQNIVIDVRGQKVNKNLLNRTANKILTLTGTKNVNVRFITN